MRLYFGLAVILLSSARSGSEICKEETMENCLAALQELMEEEYTFEERSEAELNEYCTKFQRDGDCLKDFTYVCKKLRRRKAALSEALYNHLNHRCSPGKEKRKSYIPCFGDHAYDFKKCRADNVTITKEDIQITYVCHGLKSMLCVANAGQRLCGEDGKSVAESLEYGIKESYSKYCNGIGLFNFDCWILLLSAIILFMMK